MSSRLKKVEHIVVFDMSGEMVAGEQEDSFWYLYQKEYFLGNKKITERNYNSRKLGMSKEQLDSLRNRVDNILTEPFCWTDDVENPEWVEVSTRGGSTISYMGQNKEKFLKKVIGVEPTRK